MTALLGKWCSLDYRGKLRLYKPVAISWYFELLPSLLRRASSSRTREKEINRYVRDRNYSMDILRFQGRWLINSRDENSPELLAGCLEDTRYWKYATKLQVRMNVLRVIAIISVMSVHKWLFHKVFGNCYVSQKLGSNYVFNYSRVQNFFLTIVT